MLYGLGFLSDGLINLSSITLFEKHVAFVRAGSILGSFKR